MVASGTEITVYIDTLVSVQIQAGQAHVCMKRYWRASCVYMLLKLLLTDCLGWLTDLTD